MALVLKDRVQETATPNTTVSFTCNGPVTGFQAFSTIGNGNTTYYTAVDGSGNWESGLGTYTTAGDLVTRTTILASSNAGSAVTFSGAVILFVNYPATKSVNLDASGNVSPLGTVASGTWQGSTVGVAYGGTGVTASTGANSVVLRDADENIIVNSVTQELSNTVSSATITTLTAASSHFQVLTGTTTQTYKLPDATSLPTGSTWTFDNDSTGNLTVTDNAGATIDVVAAGGYATVFLEANGTVGGEWGRFGMVPSEVNWGTNSLNLGGLTVITNGTWNGATIAYNYGGTGLTSFAAANNALYSTSASTLTAGTLPVLAGGTNSTATPTAGGVGYGTGTAHAYTTAGTSGNALISAGASAPAFGNLALGTANTNVSGALTATNGGTGVAGTLTGILYGNGTSAHSVATTAQMLTGMGVANTTTSGYLSSTDWNTFNGKQAAGSYVTVNGALGTPSSGTLTNCTFPTLNQNTTGNSANVTGTVAVANGGTGLTSLTAGYIPYGNGNSALSSSSNLTFNGSILSLNSTDAILIPKGTTGQQPTGVAGYLRFNTTSNAFEGHNGTAWGSIGGGATGGGNDQVFVQNSMTVTTSYAIPSGKSASSVGAITINSGVAVTVPSGSRWVVL